MLEIEKKSINKKQEILIISLVGIAGLLVRLYFFPTDIPVSTDAIDYFSYSIALAQGDVFPDGYVINKFGWPIFLSPFFAIINNPEMIDLMNIQRMVSVLISVLTLIPLYYLIKYFFKKEIGIVAASLFIFNPKIIENSLLGISDPLFVFFITLSIMFVFVKDSKYYFISYIIAGFGFIVRQEGILILIPLIVSFIIKKDFKIKKISKLAIGLIIFCIIAFSADFALTSDMNMSIFDTVVYAAQISEQEMIINTENQLEKTASMSENMGEFIKSGIFNYSKYLIWVLLPNLILFSIFSFIIFKKRISSNKIIILIFFIILSLTSLYAYGKGIQEVRYLFILIPIITLFSGYGINQIYSKIGKNVLMLIIPIVISSAFFLVILENDDGQMESFEDAKNVVKFAKGINNYDGGTFVKVAIMQEKWPELVPYGENRKISLEIKKFVTEKHENIEEFISKNYKKGLTHLVIYQKNNSDYLNSIYNNEQKYPYLEKVYDSKRIAEEKRVKIFYINYIEFEKNTT